MRDQNGAGLGRVILAAGVSALALLACAGRASAQVAPAHSAEEAHLGHHHEGAPSFDIRQDQVGLPTQRVLDALARHRATPAWAAGRADLAKIIAEIPDLRSPDDVVFGTPHFVRSTTRWLTPASKLEPKVLARAYVEEHRALFEVGAADLDEAKLIRDFTTQDGMMHHLTWQQTVRGVEVFDARLKANTARDGALMNVSSTMLPAPAGGWNTAAPVLSDLQALKLAAASVGIAVTADPVPNEASGADSARTWQNLADFRPEEPIQTRLVYFPVDRETLRAAWYVLLPEKGVGNLYDVIVDAVDGTVLYRHNWLCYDTEPVTMRVYGSDSPQPGSPGTETPTGFQFPFVARDMLTITPAMVLPYSPNGWIDSGNSETLGNNTDAHLDRDGTPNSPDLPRPNGGPTRTFDFAVPVDGANVITGAPTTYSNASIVNLFYHTNRYHDILYRLGFDEAARNFQFINFSGVGTGNDGVQADAQDGSGTNNANFGTTGEDGSTGRMQMYIFTGSTPDRDGTIDQEIVYHELSHGLSIRCHEGNMGTGSNQSRGMGEGWGDFFGIALNAQSTDDFAACYTTGGYATHLFWPAYVNNYYFGIRRFPYSIDLLKNPQTYADIDTNQQFYDPGVPRNTNVGNTANEVHNSGEVWCVTLIDCRASMAAAGEGFNANEVIMQLVVDGMKAAPAAPSFLDERDAILQADLNRYGGSHQTPLWAAFAKRGMGYSASSPGGASTVGIVEAFDTPEAVIFAFPDGLPSQFLPGQSTTFRVTMTPFNLTITPNTGQVFYSFNGGAFTGSDLTQTGPGEFLATIPAGPCFATVRYYLSVGTSAGVRTNPPGAPAAFHSGLVFSSIDTVLSDSMETDTGWTVGPNTATTGLWNRMDPEATAAQPGDDHTPAPGALCWVTDGFAGTGLGSFDVDGGFTTLLSPAIDLTGQQDSTLSYWRWFSNNASASGPNEDIFRVDISNNNGGSWSPLEVVGPASQNNGGWLFAGFRVGDVLPTPGAQVRLRFIAQDIGTGSVVEAAIDDLRVSRTFCDASPCEPDINGDGNVDQDDVACMINLVAGNPGCSGLDPDFNQDGNVDQDDVAALINVVAGGPCP